MLEFSYDIHSPVEPGLDSAHIGRCWHRWIQRIGVADRLAGGEEAREEEE